MSKPFENYARNLKFVSTHTYLVSQNVPFSTKTPLILLMSGFFLLKSQHFLAKIVPLLNSTFTMHPEAGFWIAENWPKSRKETMA